jgi:hypothetical protein
MTSLVTIISDTEAEIRWRDWQARGVERDRRTAKRMRRLMLLIGAVLALWFFAQLA